MENKRTCGIYMIKNLINGKMYIGQSKDVKKRLQRHKQVAKNEKYYEHRTPLHRAMKKYGEENFSYTIIEECEKEQLNEKEIYYISKYDTFKNGYNLTSGGDNPSEINPKIDLENIVEDIKNTEMNFQEIADKYGVSYEMVQGTNTGRHWYKETETYPLRKVNRKYPKIKYCKCCGKEMYNKSEYDICKLCREPIQIVNGIKIKAGYKKEDFETMKTRDLMKKYKISMTAANRIKSKFGCSFRQIEKNEEIIEWFKEGKSLKQISRETGYTTERIRNILKKNDITEEEIENNIKKK